MKTVLAAMLLATAISAQGQTSKTNRGCGPKNVWFSVKFGPARPSAQTEPGKALVFFVQRVDNVDGLTRFGTPTTTKIGLDGAWLGALKNDSYFSLSVEPGEHVVCASRQAHWPEPRFEQLVHFTAESGKTYYFLNLYRLGVVTTMPFGQAPLSQVQLMIDSDRVSVSQPQKTARLGGW